MPAPLIHIQGALRLLRDDRLPEPLARAATTRPWAYHLGSVLVDLPLFDRFPLKVALFLARRPYPESWWGTIIHGHGAGSIAAALLGRAGAAGEHRAELLALGAGVLTHLALDRVMHVPIEEAVRRHLRSGEAHSQLHEALENYQSLVWHRAHLGCDGVGSSWVDYIEVAPEGARTLPPWLSGLLGEILGEVYGQGPPRWQLDRWAAGLTGYRELLRTPLARVMVRGSEKLAHERSWVAEVELAPAYERALELGAGYLEAAGRALENTSKSLVKEVGDGPLV